MRYSRQRELVADILKNCYDHPTADVIYQRAREVDPSISLGTVYRNLAYLSALGEIITIEMVDKSVHYDGRTTDHQHFVCKECGKIIDIFSKISLPAEMENDYKLLETKCVYYGICKDCVEKIKN